MSEPKVTVRRWSGVDGEAAEALLDELSESPLPGARYARDVVRQRLPALRSEAAHEARTELLREVREKVAAMPALVPDHAHGGVHPPYLERAAVLALLAALKETS